MIDKKKYIVAVDIGGTKINISAICLSLTGLINNEGLWNPINKITLGDFKNFPVIKTLKNMALII